MGDFTIKDMLTMQQTLQEKYKEKYRDKWETICPEAGRHKRARAERGICSKVQEKHDTPVNFRMPKNAARD